MSSGDLEFDFAVVGAGPAGAVAAGVLAAAGHRVALIDGSAPHARLVGESLPGAARPLLRDLGLMAVVESSAHRTCVANASAWGTSTLYSTDAIFDPNGPGWHLDRRVFDEDLRDAAKNRGVAMLRGRARNFSRQVERWTWRVGSASHSSRWLIDATGRGALVAQRFGATRRRDDDLVAVAAWVTATTADVDQRTVVESTPDGWWYSARLPDATRVVVWHTNKRTAMQVLATRGGWARRLARTTHIAVLAAASAPLAAPRLREACGASLDMFFSDGWLAVGDAAIAFDPLSSQGIFNALYSGMRGAQAATAALRDDFTKAAAYAERLNDVRRIYLERRLQMYAAEQRWPTRRFWRYACGLSAAGEAAVAPSDVGEGAIST